MWWYNTWSRCVDLGTKLQNGEHGAIDEIKKVDEVTFGGFIQSWGTLEQRRANDEIQAVKSVLRIIHHLKRVWLARCSLGTDHLRILCDVLDGVKINKLDISGSLEHNTDAETWRQLGILVHQCGLKTLKAQMCNPTAECLKRFIQGLNGAQFNKLDISCSLRHNTDAEAWSQLGILVHHCGLKTLKALDCNSTAECLERFIQGTNGAQINKLDISYNEDIDAETWGQLGILVHQCGLKTLEAQMCNLTAECLERFIQGLNGAQFNKLDISCSLRHNTDAEAWRQLGILVYQCGLNTLEARWCHLTAECLERFIQETNGAQLDCIVMGLKYEDKFPISDVLKLLPLINEKLYIRNGINDNKVVEALQEKLNEDHLCSLTIESYNGYLKASPMDLPPNLPEVDNLEVDETNGIVQLNWSQLSVPNVSYYIVVETDEDGKAVGGPIITDETSCQLPYLRSETEYNFFIWGFTNDAISMRVAGGSHETGELNERQTTPEPSIMQNNAERSGALNPEANELTMAGNSHINESPGTSQNNGASLNDWLNTASLYKSPLECQDSSANGQGSLYRSFGGSETTMARKGNLATQQGNGISTQKKPEFDLQQFILFRHAEGNLFSGAATSTARAVPYASVHRNVQQKYIQQGTSNSVQQQPQQYPARDDGVMYNSADQGLQQPAMPVNNNPAPVLQDSQRAATFTAPAVPYASVHANMQQTYIQQDTSNSVQQQPHQYPAAADGMMCNSADQAFQQPAMSVVINPAPVSQDSQRFDANTSTGATEFTQLRFDANNSTGATELTQLTTVNPSADYGMGASATNGYPIDQSVVNVYQPTADQAASFFTDQTHNNDTNAYQPTMGQAATFSMDQTFNNDMNAYQQTADQAAANSMGQTSNNAMNDHPLNSGRVAANSLDQTSNIESDAMRTRLDKLESLVASFQNMMNMQDEKLKMQNQKMEIQDAKMKEQEEEITKLRKEVATLKDAGTSTSVDVCQLPFILPMKTKDDVEENENLLKEKENEIKLVELLSKVGGTGTVAVWRIMGKLFTDRLAKQYSWTGRKAGKNPLRKLKMKEIIFRAGLMKNVDNEPCEKAVMRWLKNASDREGGRERRNKRKGEKSGAKQTE